MPSFLFFKKKKDDAYTAENVLFWSLVTSCAKKKKKKIKRASVGSGEGWVHGFQYMDSAIRIRPQQLSAYAAQRQKLRFLINWKTTASSELGTGANLALVRKLRSRQSLLDSCRLLSCRRSRLHECWNVKHFPSLITQVHFSARQDKGMWCSGEGDCTTKPTAVWPPRLCNIVQIGMRPVPKFIPRFDDDQDQEIIWSIVWSTVRRATSHTHQFRRAVKKRKINDEAALHPSDWQPREGCTTTATWLSATLLAEAARPYIKPVLEISNKNSTLTLG